MSLYLLPGTDANLASSIFNAVDASKLEKALCLSDYHRIVQSLQGQAIHCWAFGNNGMSKYNNLNENSILLFKENGKNDFCYKGEYADKIISVQLGQAIWKAPWPYIFIIKNLKKVSIPLSNLCETLGYDDNFCLPGGIRVSDHRLCNVLRKFGTLENYLLHLEEGEIVSPKRIIVKRPRGGSSYQAVKQMDSESSDSFLWKI